MEDLELFTDRLGLFRPIPFIVFCEGLRKRTPAQFRDMVAELLGKIGGDVTPGPTGADEGVDIWWKVPKRSLAEFVAELREVMPGPLIADQAVDQLAKIPDVGEIVVQCKRWKAKVGVPVLREVRDVVRQHRATGALIVTTSEFSGPAETDASDPDFLLTLVDGRHIFALMDHHVPTFVARVLKEANVARCPVCNGGVDLARAKRSMVYEGKTYYLCRRDCLQLFQKDPEQFLKPHVTEL